MRARGQCGGLTETSTDRNIPSPVMYPGIISRSLTLTHQSNQNPVGPRNRTNHQQTALGYLHSGVLPPGGRLSFSAPLPPVMTPGGGEGVDKNDGHLSVWLLLSRSVGTCGQSKAKKKTGQRSSHSHSQ